MQKRDRPFGDTQTLVGNQQSRVNLEKLAKTGTMLTSAVRTVERKTARFYFRKRDAAISASEFFRENQIALAGDCYNHPAFSQTQSRLHRVSQARPVHSRFSHQPVHHYFNRVLFVPIKLKSERFFHRHNFSIDSRSDIAGARDMLQHAFMLAFFITDKRSENGDLRSFFQRYYPINYLGRGLPSHRLTAIGTMRLARSREKKPQIIIKLGDC